MAKIKRQIELNEEFVVTIFNGNEIINEVTNSCPSTEKLYITDDGKMLYFKQVVETNKVIDMQTIKRYFSCIVNDINESLVGVTQVKFITCSFGGSDVVKDLETQLNDFLYKTRHTHYIIDITHTQMYIAVKYQIRNEISRLRHEANEKSYQMAKK